MPAKYTKLILIICLLPGILLCILGCNAIPIIKKGLSPNPNSDPVRCLKIEMDFNQREQFFTQLRKFADKHSLEFTLSLYGSDNSIFLVAMYGDGFQISATAASDSQREINICFYNLDSTVTSEETIDELFNDLKGSLGEIPNVTIAELP